MSSQKAQQKAENRIYYFLGNLTSHALHLLPLHKKLGGTVVVLSEKAKQEVESQFNLPVICLQESPDTTLALNSQHRTTFNYLEKYASAIIFYEIFKYEDHELVPKKPVTYFLTHGNMLKNYMGDTTQREKSVKDYDYIAGLGPFMKNKFMKENDIPENKILDVGIARTDELLDKNIQGNRREATLTKLKKYGLKDSQKIISYMPTYWGDSSVYDTGLQLAVCIRKRQFLIIRPHPQTKRLLLLAYKCIATLKRNVVFAPHGSSVDISLEEAYAVSDAIIGDVSSVMLEAILLKKPLLFAYGSGAHEQDEKNYEAIKDVVNYSESINFKNARHISKRIDSSLAKGVDNKTWNSTIKGTFFLCGGKCTDKIASIIRGRP